MSTYNIGGRGSSSTKLWHVTCRYLSMINWVQDLGGAAPLKFGRTKNVQNFAWFKKTFNIERKYLWNWWRYR